MRFSWPFLYSVLVLSLAVINARAEEPMVDAVSAESASSVAMTSVSVTLPANTVIHLQTIDAVSSRLNKSGDTFRLRLMQPLMSGDTVLLPAGTPVIGEVVHAAASSMGGKAGELILAARYIDAPQGRIRLRSSLSAAGKDATSTALAVAFFTAGLGFVIRGKEMELPVDTIVSAKLAVDTTLVAQP